MIDEIPFNPDENEFGVWNKNEITFFIKNEDGELSELKRDEIRNAFVLEDDFFDHFLGWNSALSRLNELYPDNNVPDRFVEVFSESEADVVVSTFKEKEVCCDSFEEERLGGTSMNTINSVTNIVVGSNIEIFDIIFRDPEVLGTITRHEIGHTLGLGHTEREYNIMEKRDSFPYIKIINLEDLYKIYELNVFLR